MKMIWKFRINCNSIKEGQHKIELKVPRKSKPLCVMCQDGQVCIWFEVETDSQVPSEIVKFACACCGTGHARVPDDTTYFGSVMQGPYVWHLYLYGGRS